MSTFIVAPHMRLQEYVAEGKCYRALKRAQADLDLRPELYTHYYELLRRDLSEAVPRPDGHADLRSRREEAVVTAG
ncbi:MAG: hypothetical protein QGG24_10000 [Vicinamibacterales bacterium]|jgi:hypothetical protein|nr:hypothetical protein [Vicinamibacterales bacterium]MDP7478415.1 hypothetical protein [Vicinamibacterales bacterium]MDP7672823.1 hypothetical protein [Vicinamibacterales bacterium]HJO38307.1 hypothetical protein [Vicinamibacterales bacterium]|tara:strand:+ start:233 stop:460 length:228 start_codon:yes stop_codon:yes gene_type:complete